MKKDDVFFLGFLIVVLLVIAKYIHIAESPRTMGILAVLFFVIIFGSAIHK